MTRVHAGLALMLLSTTVMALGTVLQKRAVDRMPPLQSSLRGSVRALLGHPSWLLGWLLTTAGIVLNLVALGLAELTVLQPLHGFGLVVVALLSHFWLGERVGARESAGIAVAVAGVAWLGLGAEASAARVEASAYVGPLAWGWYAFAALLVVIPWRASVRRAYAGAGVAFALVAAALSVSGFTFAKGFSSTIASVGWAEALAAPGSWLLGALFLACSTAAIGVQQLSLQKGRAVVAVPVFNLVSMVLPLWPGAAIFGDAIDGQRLGAVAVIAAGALLLGASERRPVGESRAG